VFLAARVFSQIVEISAKAGGVGVAARTRSY
jgi:hypothetical protein